MKEFKRAVEVRKFKVGNFVFPIMRCLVFSLFSTYLLVSEPTYLCTSCCYVLPDATAVEFSATRIVISSTGGHM